jgi:hypothetical protein
VTITLKIAHHALWIAKAILSFLALCCALVLIGAASMNT